MKISDKIYIILMSLKPLFRLIIILFPIFTKQDYTIIISFMLIALIWGGYDLIQKNKFKQQA